MTLNRLAPANFYNTRSIEAYIAFMKHTDEIEKIEAANGSFREMFKGTNLRRTEVVRRQSRLS